MSKQRILLGNGGERTQRIGVGIHHVGAIDAERGHARTVAVFGDGGDTERALTGIECDEAPMSRRRLLQDGGRQPFGEFTGVGRARKIGRGRQFGAEQPQRARPPHQISAGRERVDVQAIPTVGGEHGWRCNEAHGVGNGAQRQAGVGLRKQLGGGAECEHAAIVGARGESCVTRSAPAVPWERQSRLSFDCPRDRTASIVLMAHIPMPVCWLNGSFVAEQDASVSIFDRGLLFGDGVYEVAAVLNGKLLDADRHLERLARSLAAVGIANAQPAAIWLDVMRQLATQNAVEEGLVYLQVTRGVAERDFPFPANTTPTMFAYARPKLLRADPNASGVRLLSVPDLRWTRCDIKSTSMLAQVLAKQSARAGGAFEAMMHEGGLVTEGGSSNLWIVNDGVAQTRPLSNDILAGITRDVVLELAHAAGVPVLERAFTVAQAKAAAECFMSSATSFILPVTKIDEHTVGTGAPGPVSTRLRAAYLGRADRLTH